MHLRNLPDHSISPESDIDNTEIMYMSTTVYLAATLNGGGNVFRDHTHLYIHASHRSLDLVLSLFQVPELSLKQSDRYEDSEEFQ